ncbi:MAG: polymer-forming cytoskeletal protein [Nitrospirota bacterium]
MFDKKPKEVEASEVMTFLGKGAHFKGVLTFDGTARLDGEIEGEIITQGMLIIGESGVIKAEITAGSVVVGGHVTGNIHATQKIQILPKATVTGSLTTHSIIIEDGAILNGICEMKESAEKEFASLVSERDSLYKEGPAAAKGRK